MPRLVRTALGAAVAAALLSGSAFAPAVGAVVHAPRVRVALPGGTGALGWTSSNWSGYAITSSTFTSVTGSWIVPTVTRSKKATYSASWTGIDGFNNSNLIQAGTGQDYAQGRASYYAWWEILPAPETRIGSLTIRPGDHVTASISKGSGSSWTIKVTDDSTGQSFTTTQTYTGPGSSAEWIEEAPTVGGHQATIANYGQTTFDPGTANGKNPGLVAKDGGVLVQNGRQVSTPSNPDGDTDGFNIAYGSIAPSAPAS